MHERGDGPSSLSAVQYGTRIFLCLCSDSDCRRLAAQFRLLAEALRFAVPQLRQLLEAVARTYPQGLSPIRTRALAVTVTVHPYPHFAFVCVHRPQSPILQQAACAQGPRSTAWLGRSLSFFLLMRTCAVSLVLSSCCPASVSRLPSVLHPLRRNLPQPMSFSSGFEMTPDTFRWLYRLFDPNNRYRRARFSSLCLCQSTLCSSSWALALIFHLRLNTHAPPCYARTLHMYVHGRSERLTCIQRSCWAARRPLLFCRVGPGLCAHSPRARVSLPRF